MLCTRVLSVLFLILSVGQIAASPSHPQSGYKALRNTRRDPTTILNPLLAGRQVDAKAIRRGEQPSRTKRQPNECPTPQVSGGCCPPGSSICTDSSGNAQCTTGTSSDPQNCGSCGNACPTGDHCSDGLCCPGGFSNCGDGYCVVTSDSINSCGAACAVCGYGQVCQSGECVTCPAPEMACEGSCIDPLTNSEYCGDCHIQCSALATCSGGICCGNGQQGCNGVCTDTMNDSTACGAACQSCGSDALCLSGACVSCDGPGMMFCGTSCIDTLTDDNNCGTCGNSCTAYGSCSNGACVCDPTLPVLACDNTCIFPSEDPNNCGSCGIVCDTSAGYICDSGTCYLPCDIGYKACNGVCVYIAEDPQNCGTCGYACAPGQLCSYYACTACPSTYEICDGSVCTDIQTDNNNCGSCGKICDGSCVDGQCCPSGSTMICNGKCTDTTSDPNNCEACGNVCGALEYCNGYCAYCLEDGWIQCNNVCQNYNSAQQCGSCTHACPSGAAGCNLVSVSLNGNIYCCNDAYGDPTSDCVTAY